MASHGTRTTHSQMLFANKLVSDTLYRDFYLEDLKLGAASARGPTLVQLGGSDVESCVQAARLVEPYCDGIGIVSLDCSTLSTLDTRDRLTLRQPRIHRSELRMPSRHSDSSRLWFCLVEQATVADSHRHCLSSGPHQFSARFSQTQVVHPHQAHCRAWSENRAGWGAPHHFTCPISLSGSFVSKARACNRLFTSLTELDSLTADAKAAPCWNTSQTSSMQSAFPFCPMATLVPMKTSSAILCLLEPTASCLAWAC